MAISDVTRDQDDLTISPEGLAKLDQALEKFAEFRQDEEQYLAQERTYKEELFNHLSSIWDVLDKDPEESRQMLLRFMRKEGIDGKFVGSFDNLVGRFGFADRGDFAVYLENIDLTPTSKHFRTFLTMKTFLPRALVNFALL